MRTDRHEADIYIYIYIYIAILRKQLTIRQYSICLTGNLCNRKVSCLLWVPITISYPFSSTSSSGYATCSTSNLILTASEILSLTFITRLVQEVKDITIVCPNPCLLTVHDHYSFSFNIRVLYGESLLASSKEALITNLASSKGPSI
jgi:hypothetical protein